MMRFSVEFKTSMKDKSDKYWLRETFDMQAEDFGGMATKALALAAHNTDALKLCEVMKIVRLSDRKRRR